MTLFTTNRLALAASLERITKNSTTASLLRESRIKKSSNFDVFLSHSRMDAELVQGAKTVLETYGLTVYVDWVDDPQLDRSAVSAAAADILRLRMQTSRSLVYAHTVNSSLSKWCPWELGYFDGVRGGNVFVLPIVDLQATKFVGQDYLGLYPYLDSVGASIFINYPSRSLPLRDALKIIFSPNR
jgi:hypothetical protein